MTLKKIFLISLGFLSASAFAKHSSKQQSEKPTIIFVCGGNTGRSFMGEWLTRHQYSNEFSSIFSRGTGNDPGDDVQPEHFAVEVLQENSDILPGQTQLHRATALNIIDLNNASVVLFMAGSHLNRAKLIVERDCNPSNWEALGITGDRMLKWKEMCFNKQTILNKMHTLIGCATGTDGDIADAYGQPKEFYTETRNKIKKNIDQIMSDYKATGHWCVKS